MNSALMSLLHAQVFMRLQRAARKDSLSNKEEEYHRHTRTRTHAHTPRHTHTHTHTVVLNANMPCVTYHIPPPHNLL